MRCFWFAIHRLSYQGAIYVVCSLSAVCRTVSVGDDDGVKLSLLDDGFVKICDMVRVSMVAILRFVALSLR